MIRNSISPYWFIAPLLLLNIACSSFNKMSSRGFMQSVLTTDVVEIGLTIQSQPKVTDDSLKLIIELRNLGNKTLYSTFDWIKNPPMYEHKLGIEVGYAATTFEEPSTVHKRLTKFAVVKELIEYDMPIYPLKRNESRELAFNVALTDLGKAKHSKDIRVLEFNIRFCYVLGLSESELKRDKDGNFIIGRGIYYISLNCETLQDTMDLYFPNADPNTKI